MFQTGISRDGVWQEEYSSHVPTHDPSYAESMGTTDLPSDSSIYPEPRLERDFEDAKVEESEADAFYGAQRYDYGYGGQRTGAYDSRPVT